MIKLIGEVGQYAGNELEINKEIILGRNASECQLVFQTQSISSKHCKLTQVNDKLYITDLGSTNGTFLSNGMRLKPNESVELRDGDRFYLSNQNNMFAVKIVNSIGQDTSSSRTLNDKNQINYEHTGYTSKNKIMDGKMLVIIGLGVAVLIAVIVIGVSISNKKKADMYYQEQLESYKDELMEKQQEINDYNNRSPIDKTFEAVDSWLDFFE